MCSRSSCRCKGHEDPTQHDAPEAATAARYQPGAWERAGDALRVHHGDQIGTSRFMTNAAAQTARRAVFTAFGELVMADDGNGQPAALSRYGYAGAWGYETGLDDAGEPELPPLPFIHVGERWYDPSSGRFLQRDPIGIIGGLNTYNYVQANPTYGVDPEGLRDDAAWDSYYRWRDQLPPDERSEIDKAAGVVGGIGAAAGTAVTAGGLVAAAAGAAATHTGIRVVCGRLVLIIRHEGGKRYNTTINLINRVTGKRYGFGRHYNHKGGSWHLDK